MCIKAFLDIETDTDGLLDSDYLSRITNMETPQAYLKISVLAGSTYVIPVTFSFSTNKIVFLKNGDYDNNSSLSSSYITELNFGSLVHIFTLKNSLLDQVAA